MINIDHLSYSSISLFQSCSEAWRRKYIAKEPTFGSPALVFGTAFHNTLEKHLTSGEEPVSLWRTSWQRASTDESRGKVNWNGELPEQHYNEGVRMFTHPDILAGIETIRAQYDGGGIERKVTLMVPGVPVPIIGFIDVMLAGGVPGDFKTSSSRWTEARAQGEQQPLFYLAALNQAGQPVPGGQFKHFVFVKTKKPQFQELVHTHGLGEVMQLFTTIRKVWAAIEAEVFVKNTGSWKCSAKYCDFWGDCQGKHLGR